MDNHIHCKTWGEITNSFANNNGEAIEDREWKNNSSHICLGMWLHIHAVI